MTGFSISIPHRDRSEPLSLVAAHARHLGQDEDRRVCRQLVIQARLDGVATTAGELLDHVEALEPAERRAMLNTARKALGLPSVEELEAQQPRPFTLNIRTGVSGGFPSCPAEGCTASPTRNGIFYSPDCRKWWCDAHADQAQPGDLEPRGSGLVYSSAGVPIDFDPAADEADRAREESRRAQLQAQAEIRAVEAAEAAKSKRVSDEAHRRELPEHLRRMGA
jgi:hypothetical protein